MIVSARATCSRLNVGAIIHDNRGVIFSSGYNGAPEGTKHCDHLGDVLGEPCKVSVHAELNAILWAAKYGRGIDGQQMMCTHAPCRACASAIVQVGIVMVRFIWQYRNADGLEVLTNSGVEIEEVD